MMRQIALFSIWLLLWSGIIPLYAGQSTQNAKPSLKEQVVLMAAGSIVDVRTKSKERITGRLGAVTNDGFEIQYVSQDKALTRSLAFQDVKSVKPQHQGWSTAAKVTLGVLAGVGSLFLILALIYAATES